jgi:hypothetical protein
MYANDAVAKAPVAVSKLDRATVAREADNKK